jgi:hypothetical protein
MDYTDPETRIHYSYAGPNTHNLFESANWLLYDAPAGSELGWNENFALSGAGVAGAQQQHSQQQQSHNNLVGPRTRRIKRSRDVAAEIRGFHASLDALDTESLRQDVKLAEIVEENGRHMADIETTISETTAILKRATAFTETLTTKAHLLKGEHPEAEETGGEDIAFFVLGGIAFCTAFAGVVIYIMKQRQTPPAPAAEKTKRTSIAMVETTTGNTLVGNNASV